MFEQVVFAGGGHRCWWQAGFWDVVQPELELKPRLIAGVSAGAATACLMYAGNALEALEYYDNLLGTGSKNFYWSRLVRRGERAFPHDDIYRAALLKLFDDARFKELLWNAPELRVVYARLPRWLGPKRAVLVGMLAYNTEKRLYRPLHPRWGRQLGFTSEYARIQDCKNSQDLASLLIASACTPPFTRAERRDEQPTLDGGMVDNVPVHAVETDASTLVMLTRQYPQHAQVFSREGRIYVQPSAKIPTSAWDYTQPKNYRDTYQLGRRDAHAFLRGFRFTENRGDH
jgi:predicted acylesterase/phospholipase RssA